VTSLPLPRNPGSPVIFSTKALLHYARAKVRELLKLGTYLKTAISAAISRKDPWHLARTLATQTGMSKIPPSGPISGSRIRVFCLSKSYG